MVSDGFLFLVIYRRFGWIRILAWEEKTLSVWVTIPSARPVAEVAKWAAAWHERGYKIALWRDGSYKTQCALVLSFKGDHEEISPVVFESEGSTAQISVPGLPPAHLIIMDSYYPGYARAVNWLVDAVSRYYADAEWFIAAGDDVFPDPNHTADEIAEECEDHFRRVGREITNSLSTFGVMQPTGDRWGENPNHARPDMRSAYIDRIAGSAWYGREYCKRVNQGKGPLWPEYQHMFVDEEARAVAVQLGVYWERRDLTQMHMHPGRVKNYTVDMIPEHMKKWASAEHWKEAEAIFFRRRKEGFPGSEALCAS